MRRMARAAVVLGILVVMALSGGLAQASSTCQAYNPQLCSSVSAANTTPSTGSTAPSTGSTAPSTGSRTPSTRSTTASEAGTLPFTGLDVVLLVAGGGALLSAGFVIRRAARRLN